MTRRMSNTEIVDDALTRYVKARRARGIEPKGVFARTLATIAEIDVGTMSDLLQQYRQAQSTPEATRFVIAAEGYGRAARWKILSKPGSDPAVVQEARRKHAEWIAVDGLNRVMRDVAHEINPGLHASVATDRLIEREVAQLVGHLKVSVRALEHALTPVDNAS